MQQAYRVLRIVSAAQAIRIVLSPNPDVLTLEELCRACMAFNSEGSSGIKAVVLDLKAGAAVRAADQKDVPPAIIERARRAADEVQAPVLVVVRGSLGAPANALLPAADLRLAADNALLSIPAAGRQPDDGPYTGEQALRLGLVNWSVAVNDVDREMERVLDLLRDKSAVALREAKASVRLAAAHLARLPAQETEEARRLAALRQVNEFYLARVMQTADAAEGLRAFLEKRKPQWSNR
jgi:Enoyl-CoA hydratase/isomerase